MNSFFRSIFISLLLATCLILPGVAPADVVLPPGYITGTVTVGDYTVNSLSINAYGGGYSSSKSVNGNNYSLTVFAGDWDYGVNMYAYFQDPSTYYPYTGMYFKPRTVRVSEGQTVTNDYAVNAGAIRFQLTINGDAYSYWQASTSAYQYPNTGEQTQSYGYTYSYYSPEKVWDMMVVSNDQISVSAGIYIDNVYYNAFPNGLTVNVGPGETVVVPITITHTAGQPSQFGTVQGVVDLANASNFNVHYVYGGNSSASVTTNPGPYTLNNVYAGSQYFNAYSYFDDYRTYLQWPYEGGDYNNSLITIEPGMTYNKNFVNSAGSLSGGLNLLGTIQNANPSNTYTYLYAYGAGSVYDPGQGWVVQPSNGGYAQTYSNGVSSSYRMVLTPGMWLPYFLYTNGNDYTDGYYRSFTFYIYDYKYYYNGDYYNYGTPAIITAGASVTQDRSYCTGSAAIRFRVAGGGTVSYPQISGSMATTLPDGKPDISGYAYGSTGEVNAEAPVVEVHGVPGPYTFSTYAQTADGSNVSFGNVGVVLECGVRKGLDLSGPTIILTNPPAGLITNAALVSVTGLVSDDAGVSSITVNGNAVNFTPTNNPNAPNEVVFSYDLPVTNGANTITVVATDALANESSDQRTISVDGWMPSVAIATPVDGSVISSTTPVSVSVQAADQGYGYFLRVYLDGQLLGQVVGAADATLPVVISFAQDLGVLSPGAHVIAAVASDIAGNTASASSTFTVIAPPTVSANGPYTVNEGGTIVVSATGSSPNGGPLSYAWDLNNDGIFETPGQNATFSAAGLDGPSVRTISVQVVDKIGLAAIGQTSVTILNVAPAVSAITAPMDPIAVQTSVTAGGQFTDPGVLDTHTAEWTWGDGGTSSGVVTEANGSGSVSGSHAYSAAGVYTITLTVTDKDGASGSSVYRFVVVYDPGAGFVTGGGWINSPQGAYAPNPSVTNKVNFGFVSKYQTGSAIPSGQTEFNFSAAGMNFHSERYEWLVVAGAKAQYKGMGTINGAGNYEFLVTVVDGDITGGADRFRIRIWDAAGVVYDSQPGQAEDAEPSAIEKGSIVIH